MKKLKLMLVQKRKLLMMALGLLLITGNLNSLYVYAQANDRDLTYHHNNMNIYEYRYLLDIYNSSGDVTVMISANAPLTLEPDGAYYKLKNETGGNVLHSRELYYDYASAWGNDNESDWIVPGGYASGYGQIESIIKQERYVSGTLVDWDTGLPPVVYDYGNPVLSVTPIFSGDKITVSDYGDAYDQTNLIVQKWNPIIEQLEQVTTYTNAFNLQDGNTTQDFMYLQGDGWTYSEQYAYSLELWSDGTLVDTLHTGLQNAIEYQIEEGGQLNDLVFKGWKLEYFDTYYTITNTMNDYSGVNVQIWYTDLPLGESPVTGSEQINFDIQKDVAVPLDYLSTGEPLEWNRVYEIRVTKHDPLSFKTTEYYRTVFEYGASKGNQADTINEVGGVYNGSEAFTDFDWLTIKQDTEEIMQFASEGTGIVAYIFGIMPYPIPQVFTVVIFLIPIMFVLRLVLGRG